EASAVGGTKEALVACADPNPFTRVDIHLFDPRTHEALGRPELPDTTIGDSIQTGIQGSGPQCPVMGPIERKDMSAREMGIFDGRQTPSPELTRAPSGAHPNPPAVILRDRADFVGGQTLIDRVLRESATAQAIHPTAVGPDPQVPVTILEQGQHVVARKALT